MQVSVTNQSADKVEADTVMVGLFEGVRELTGAAAELDEALGGRIGAVLEAGDLRGKPDETVVLFSAGVIPAKRVVLVGLGKQEELTVEHCRKAGAAAARAGHKRGAICIASEVLGMVSEKVPAGIAAQATVEGVLMGLYQCKDHKTEPPKRVPVQEVSLIAPKEHGIEDGVKVGQILADAVCTARDLVNQPGNHMKPSQLADVARAIALTEGLECEVLEEDRMGELNMGALLGVAQGSAERPRFIILEHKGDGSGPTVVLVGKGITFDSGGISLKTRDHMEEMKTDMAGAAAVIATMQGVARLKLPSRVIGLAPAAENLPSGDALKPGDVITAMNGKSIEVINTDAEGRLILADALCYASRYEPDAVIDIATLTGACIVALGEEVAGGVFASDDTLCDALIASGDVHGEKLWRLPLYEEYRDRIKSDVADMKNTGGRYGGVGTSALFLKEFTSYPWAHLDIAGMALAKNDSPYIPKGGTGFGVRTLLSYCMNGGVSP